MKLLDSLPITILLILVNSLVNKCSKDWANQKETSGAQVVEHVVDTISQTCLLDNGLFLRRMAYVETRDGTNTLTYRTGYHGGIWNIDETMFKRTKNQRSLQSDYDTIKQNLFIDWSKVTWEDLRTPLKSGLAAALYIRSLNIRTLPDNPEIQATIWGSLRPNNNAGTFFLDSQAIQTNCRHTERLDLIIALDFAHLPPVELARIQLFLQTFLRSFSISQNSTRVGLVTKRLMPKAGWYLNSDRPGFTLLNALKALTYTPGPTFTGDMLEFIRQTMFNSTLGARSSAARAVLLMTDGITQYSYAKDEANKLAENGISLAIIEVDVNGNSTSRDQLNALVSETGCKNTLIVRTYAALEKNSHEIQESLCNAPVQLKNGLNTYSCSETVHLKIADTSDSTSIQVLPSAGAINIFASKAYTRPDATGHGLKLTSTTSSSPVLYMRGIDSMFITIQANESSDTCTGNFNVQIKKGNTFTGVNGTCVVGGVVRECTSLDMSMATHDIVLVRDPSDLDLCNHNTHTVEYFPHPLDTGKFIMCDQHETRFIGLCPVSQTNCIRFTSGCKYTNPCTPDAILNDKMFYSDPCADPETFIQCNHFGVAEVLSCGSRKLWNQDTHTCVYKYVHNVLLGSEVANISNPCLHNHEEHAYFPYPLEPAKYIFCDAKGNAFESTCRSGIWNQQTKSCMQSSPQIVPIG